MAGPHRVVEVTITQHRLRYYPRGLKCNAQDCDHVFKAGERAIRGTSRKYYCLTCFYPEVRAK